MKSPETIVVVQNLIHLQECGLYRNHECAVTNLHHICPESWWLAAGQPVRTPKLSLCPTCHYNVHAAVDGLLRGYDVGLIPPRCVKLAREAFEIAKTYGLTPALTL